MIREKKAYGKTVVSLWKQGIGRLITETEMSESEKLGILGSRQKSQ